MLIWVVIENVGSSSHCSCRGWCGWSCSISPSTAGRPVTAGPAQVAVQRRGVCVIFCVVPRSIGVWSQPAPGRQRRARRGGRRAADRLGVGILKLPAVRDRPDRSAGRSPTRWSPGSRRRLRRRGHARRPMSWTFRRPSAWPPRRWSRRCCSTRCAGARSGSSTALQPGPLRRGGDRRRLRRRDARVSRPAVCAGRARHDRQPGVRADARVGLGKRVLSVARP